MDDQGIATMLREVERNEPTIAWADVKERTPGRLPLSPRRWPTVVVAIAAVALPFAFLLAAIRPFGQGTAGSGPAGAILFDRRATIASSDVAEQRSQIWSVRPDGTGARLLFDVPEAYDEAAVWSPDGSRILFTSVTPEGEGGLYLIDADGSGLREVRRRFACDAASWFPGGRRALCAGGPWSSAEEGGYVSDRGIWLVDVDSGEVERSSTTASRIRRSHPTGGGS